MKSTREIYYEHNDFLKVTIMRKEHENSECSFSDHGKRTRLILEAKGQIKVFWRSIPERLNLCPAHSFPCLSNGCILSTQKCLALSSNPCRKTVSYWESTQELTSRPHLQHALRGWSMQQHQPLGEGVWKEGGWLVSMAVSRVIQIFLT